jgi:carbamoyl-phosphate synthase/aspartate carbamoyltransferase/dihydroorotase
MPNTQPPITSAETLSTALKAARKKARCDYAQYLGAGPANANVLSKLANQTAGLKMYLDQTYGPLRLDDMSSWMSHFAAWPVEAPLVAHAEGRSMAAVILMAALYDRPLHIAHVSRKEEILLILAAKERGLKVTCEVCPHHLFLTEDDMATLGEGRGEVRPRLATPRDRDALWENLAVIDCFATDHAPHTLAEKDSADPPPGFPGLETALPLFLTAVHQGRLTNDDLYQKMYANPKRIFNIPEQPDTWVVIDPHISWEINSARSYSRCAWTPFDGSQVRGRLLQVVLRGKCVFSDGEVHAQPGFGVNIRKISV